MTDRKKWVVTLSRERSPAEMRRDLEAAGFRIDQVLDDIGVVIGEGSAEAADKLRAVGGVADVSPDAPVGLDPPDS